MTGSTTTLRHRPLLDGVRGVLMSVVVGYHLGGFLRLPGGWVAMDLFFVLSGYLITTLLVKEEDAEGRISFGTFYRRRVRRLAPALLLVVAVVVAVVALAGWTSAFPNLRRDGLAALLYVANWHFIWSDQSYFTSFQQSPFRHTWSLAIEEQFYLLWPPIFLGLSRLVRGRGRRRAVPGTAVSARSRLGLGSGWGGVVVVLVVATLASAWWMRHLVLGGADLSRAYYGTDTRVQGLLIGAVLALVLWPDRWDTERGRRAGGIVGSAGAVALAVMMVRFHDDSTAVYTRFGFVAIGLACAALVFGAVRAEGGPLSWVFGNRVTRHLGAISYVAYLWHWPVIVLLAPPRVDLDPSTARWVQVAVTLVLSEVTHRWIEAPIHRGRLRFRFDGAALAGAAVVVLVLVLLLPGPTTSSAPPSDAGRVVVRPAEPPPRTPTTTVEPGDTVPEDPPPPPPERVLMVGDSTAWVNSTEAPDDLPFRLDAVFRARCDIVGARLWVGDRVDPEGPACPGWPDEWRAAVAETDPDVVVVTLGLRQLFDPEVDGVRLVVGSDAWERHYRAAVDRAVAVLREGTDAPVLWLDVPCQRWAEAGSAGEEEDPARTAAVNRVLLDQLAGHPRVSVVPYRSWVCPGGRLDLGLRPDGAHLAADAVADLWHHVLVPRILVATGG